MKLPSGKSWKFRDDSFKTRGYVVAFFSPWSFTVIITDMDKMIRDEWHISWHLLVSNGCAFLRSLGSFYVYFHGR